jgi:SH3-like domain-containing protein
MNAIPADAVNFQIWTDERLEEFAEDPDTEPLGQGTSMTEGSGFTNWQGGSPEAETYYIVVTATGEAPARFLLNVSSAALAADQPAAVVPQPVAPAEPPVEVDPNIAVVTTELLNVRSGPSTAYPVLLTVPSGTQMTVLGRNAINSWINIQLEDGTEGWVTRTLTSYALVSPNVVDAPPLVAEPVDATGATTPTTTTTTPVVTTAVFTTTELGSSWQVLAPGEIDWYSFQYRGGQLPLTIWMDMEPFDDARFTIVDAETARAMMGGTLATPTTVVGRGRSNPVEPGYHFWQADFVEADTFYVMVEATASAGDDVFYSLYALGPGVARIVEPVEIE